MAGTKVSGSAVVPTVAMGLMEATVAISIAALLFVGEASSHLGAAAIALLIGNAIGNVVVTWRSNFSVVVARAQSNLAVVMSAVTVGIAADAGPDDAGITVWFFVVASTLGAALLIYAVGRFRLGKIVRFIPTPVISGFLAATGWLLLVGGFNVSFGRSLGLDDVSDLLFDWTSLQRWIPAVILAIVIALSRSAGQTIGLVGSVAGFHIIVSALGNRDRVEADGWTLGPLPDASQVSVFNPVDIADVDWQALSGGLPGLFAVAIIALLLALLGVSGLESSNGDHVDVDRELRVSGAATAASGAVGGSIVFGAIGSTALARDFSLTSKAVTIALVGVTAATVVAGLSAIEQIPRFVAGGLLLSPALSLLRSWVRDSLLGRPIADQLVTAAIPIAVAVFGLLPGVGLGIALAVVLFVWRYAAIDPVRVSSSVAAMRSALDRPTEDEAFLDEQGHRIVVRELSGYLFFGSAAGVAQEVRDAVADRDDDQPLQVLIDFRRVSGMDTSAISELAKIEALCESDNVRLHYSFDPAKFPALAETCAAHTHVDLDHGLEAAEDVLLAERSNPVVAASTEDAALPADLLQWFWRVEVEAGMTVIRAGDETSRLFYVESGELEVMSTVDDQASIRLRRVRPGSFLGEVNFFGGKRANATVVVRSPGVLWFLDRDYYNQLRVRRPETAIAMHELILAETGRRLTQSNRLVRDLLR